MLYLGAQQGTSNMTGGQWDAAVEGTQNFTDFSDHGDIAQDAEEYPYNLESLEDYQQQHKWNVALGSSAGPAAMRRTASHSSAGSFKTRTIRASQHKTRPRLQTDVSAGASATFSASSSASAAGYGMTGQAFAANGALASAMSSASSLHPYYQDGSVVSGAGRMDMNQDYMTLYSHGLPPTTAFHTDALPYSSDLGAGLGQHVQQHVDPTCTQMNMDFETSPPAVSPQTWGSSSSRRSSPDLGGEDTWSLPVAASPAESHDSTVSSFPPQFDSDSALASMSDDFTLSGPFQQKQRSNSEGESARDHPLYKTAACQSDGLYHCPWEGKDNCNHKPEKLKCNYDKFVDSHLKPYRCKHSSCENARFSSTACLLRHEREAHAMHGHGDKPYLCPHAGCERSQHGNGFPRQWNLKDHMRRVHHDNGLQLSQSASASSAIIDSMPVAPSSSQAVAKGRKRKKDSVSSQGSASSASSRKSSSSKASSRSQENAKNHAEQLAVEAANKAQLERTLSEWNGHKRALESIVQGFTMPTDPQMPQYLQTAQEHMRALNLISTEMTNSVQAPFIRSFPQQSG